MLACTVAAIVYAMMRVDGADLFPACVGARAAGRFQPACGRMTAADQKLVDALMRLMADERIYRQENITIGVLADQARRFPNTGCAG